MKRETKHKRSASKSIKAIALSQIFIMILEIFAVSFIFTMSLGEVNSEITQQQFDNAKVGDTFTVYGNTQVTKTADGWVEPLTSGGTLVTKTWADFNANYKANGVTISSGSTGSTGNMGATVKSASPAITPLATSRGIQQGSTLLGGQSSTWYNPTTWFSSGAIDTQNEITTANQKLTSLRTALANGNTDPNWPTENYYTHQWEKSTDFPYVSYAVEQKTRPVSDATLTSMITDQNKEIAGLNKDFGTYINNYNANAQKMGIGPIQTQNDANGVTQYYAQRYDVNGNPFTVRTLNQIKAYDADLQKAADAGFIDPKTGLGNYAKYQAIEDARAKGDILTPQQVSDENALKKISDDGKQTMQAASASGTTPGAGPTGRTEPYSTIFEKIGPEHYIAGNLLEGLQWAIGAWGFVKILGEMGLVDKEMTEPLGQALFGGIMVGKSVNALFESGVLGTDKNSWAVKSGGTISTVAGIITAYLIFANNYKKTQTRTYTVDFKCMSWQAPKILDKNTRQTECNKCNIDPLRPCSEYRCKALGQTCKIINEGTALVKCIDGGVDDVNSPGIKPFKEILNSNYSYSNVRERPAGKGTGQIAGMSITSSSGDSCLQAWTPFDFGVITFDRQGNTQPAQCKIDFNHTVNFDAMNYWMGETNLFIENHSQRITLPGTDSMQSTFPELQNNGDYKLYIRCKNGNGNTNDDEFVVSFCIDKTPDLTPPVIKTTSPVSGSPVLYNVDNLSASVYTDEPATCKWSRKDSDYNAMENNMTCSNNVWEMNAESYYTCNTILTGIKNKQENDFYFRCQDLSAQKNTMTESYLYSLIGTQPLTILSTGPSETIGSSTSTANISLTVTTDNGYKNGEARCFYSTSNDENSYQEMFVTGNISSHSQPLDLTGGTYKYYFKCLDLGGNTAYNSTSFTVYIDKYAPQILRLYNMEGKIRMITDEDSICKYSTTSCNFDINKEGIINMPYDWTKEHWAEWKTDQTYYIKCMDKFNNQPDPAECSIIIRPYQLSQQAA